MHLLFGKLAVRSAITLALFQWFFRIFTVTNIEHWIEVGGPIVIFSLLFACGLGLPLPEDIPLLIGGFLVANGKMHLIVVAVLAWLGIIGGDCMLYNLGRRYGRNITLVPFIGKHLTEARIVKAEKLFEHYGVWVVGVGRLLAGIRGAMVVAAGTTRFNFVKFVIADGLAALVSGGLFVGLGYLLGRKYTLEQIEAIVNPYKFWIGVGIGAGGVLTILYFWWKSKRERTVAEIAAEKIVKRAEKRDPSANPDAVAE